MHMRVGIVLHQEEPRTHCSSMGSDEQQSGYNWLTRNAVISIMLEDADHLCLLSEHTDYPRGLYAQRQFRPISMQKHEPRLQVL